MRSAGPETSERFEQVVAELLELPTGAGDAEVRTALRAMGSDLLAWYDNRLQAIAESKHPRSPRQ